ncbi:MAG: 2-hydroxyacid dehydrogenase [Eubacteriales bacterium]|nr:2-hydroxyacid dehydrogenase [Eubacteriales bacterium]
MKNAAMFDTKPYDRESFEKYNGKDGIFIKYFDTRLTEDTAGLAENSDTVIAFVNDVLNAAVIDKLYGCGVKLIALRCAGFNNVDVKAAFGKIHVVRVPAYSPYAVAEHAMALLLTSVRRTHKAYNRIKDFNFSLNGLTGFDLYGKTVGVVGTGKIGKIFINICNGFGMKVIAYDLYPDKTLNAEYVSLEKLFESSDIISLHCPLTSDNYHMINRENIARMKSGVVLINTSRGSLIDAEALLDGIKSKKIGAACLDVYEEESDIFFEDKSGHIMQDDVLARLLTMPNVLLTSHQAFLTREALDNIAATTIGNIKAFFDSDIPENEICYRCGRIEECRKERKEKCF